MRDLIVISLTARFDHLELQLHWSRFYQTHVDWVRGGQWLQGERPCCDNVIGHACAVRQSIQQVRDCFARGGYELQLIWSVDLSIVNTLACMLMAWCRDGVEEDVKQDTHRMRYTRRVGEMQ